MINPKKITNHADWLDVLNNFLPTYQQSLKEWASKKWPKDGTTDLNPEVYINAIASYNELIHCADTLAWYEKNNYNSIENPVFKAILDRMNRLVEDLSGFIVWAAII